MRSKNNFLWGESSTRDSTIYLVMDIMHRIKENQLTGHVTAEWVFRQLSFNKIKQGNSLDHAFNCKFFQSYLA